MSTAWHWKYCLDTEAERKIESYLALLVSTGEKGTVTFLQGFPCGSAGKKSACSAEDLGSIPGVGRFAGEEKGYPLQYSGLENSMDCKEWVPSTFTFLKGKVNGIWLHAGRLAVLCKAVTVSKCWRERRKIGVLEVALGLYMANLQIKC